MQTLDPIKIGTKLSFCGFYDSNAGWEFDAPLHIFVPFHMYFIVSSLDSYSVIENILIDLASGLTLKPETDEYSYWPYPKSTCYRHFLNARKGKARCGIEYFEHTVNIQDLEKCKWQIKSGK